MLDLTNITAAEVVDAIITLEELATAAEELHPGDRIVYRHNKVCHVSAVETIEPYGKYDRWVTITTTSGDSWSCSRLNRGQYRLPPCCPECGETKWCEPGCTFNVREMEREVLAIGDQYDEALLRWGDEGGAQA